jgi:hypothetical protein
VPAIGVAIAVPIYALAYTRPDWRWAALILLVPGVFHYTYLGPTFGVIQNAVDQRRRATATALLFFVLNLIALGGGPPFTGWAIDQFAQFGFTHPGPHGFVHAFTQTFFQGGAAGRQFIEACPGGLAKPGSAPGLGAACHDVLAQATRRGMLVTFFFYAWGAFHYFLAALTLPGDLRRAAAERGEA